MGLKISPRCGDVNLKLRSKQTACFQLCPPADTDWILTTVVQWAQNTTNDVKC